MEKELNYLSKLELEKNNLTLLLGGSKVSTKLSMIKFFLEKRSAKAPAKGATTVIGKAKVNVTNVSAKGESSVTLKISQLLVIICIFIAMKDTNDPIQTHLKSRYERVSNMLDTLIFRIGFRSVVTL